MSGSDKGIRKKLHQPELTDAVGYDSDQICIYCSFARTAGGILSASPTTP